MKYVALIFSLCSSLILTGCIFKSGKKMFPESLAKTSRSSLFYEVENVSVDWNCDELWELLQPLSETEIPEGFSYNNYDEEKEYVLKLTWYLQSISPEGISYDEDRKVYMLELADAQYFAKVFLGIHFFIYPECSEYNELTDSFEKVKYPGIGRIQRVYENMDLKKVQNDKWSISVDVFEANENGEKISPGTKETYVVDGKGKTYKLISVQREILVDEKGTEKDEQPQQVAD
ncbi:MAG: hypothetical protein LBJ83_02250 [Oscillospiraceae bacterium]|jgi:hypothetical protein|nr:hypothetical protein [Oscillospiraceae bacterium]